MRTRQEIDVEYSHICKLYGDRVFKAESLNGQIVQFKTRMTELMGEPASDELPPPPSAPPALAAAPEPEEAKAEA